MLRPELFTKAGMRETQRDLLQLGDEPPALEPAGKSSVGQRESTT